MGLNSLAGEGGDSLMDEYIISPQQQRGGAGARAGRNLEGREVSKRKRKKNNEQKRSLIRYGRKVWNDNVKRQ